MKLSDFRQAWINGLRDCLAELQSIGMTPDQEAKRNQRFYELGTKIELMMNNKDEDYEPLQKIMYRLLSATNQEEKYGCNAEFVEVCQRILKREWKVLKVALRAAAQQNS
jgi:hypothetical protein